MGKTLVFQWMGLLMVLGAAYAQSQPMPDLIVDPKLLRENWIVHTENFTASQCDAVEGGISAGEHPIMRFTVSTPNIGDADEVVGDPRRISTPTTGFSSSRPATTTFTSGIMRCTN